MKKSQAVPLALTALMAASITGCADEPAPDNYGICVDPKTEIRVEDEVPHPDVRVSVVLPYDQGSLVSRIHSEGEVLLEEHTEEGTCLEARVKPQLAEALASYLVA